MMKTAHRISTALKVIATILLGASVSACASTSQNWKEEALQHDGSKIIVARTVKLGGRHEVGQKPPFSEQSLAFTLPGSRQKVVWEDPFTVDIGGANFLPMLLEVQGDVAYVVAYPAGCLSYNKWGRPNPPYVVFKYQNRQWTRIALQELPPKVETPNLIFSSPDDEGGKAGERVVSAETIKTLYANYQQAHFRRILRVEIADAGGSQCFEMTGNGKGRWVANSTFSKQPSYEACINSCFVQDFGPQYCPCDRLFKGK